MYLFDFEQKYTFKMIWSSHVPTIIYNNLYLEFIAKLVFLGCI